MIFKDIDWIFFDVGGVLLDDTEAERLRMQLLLKICSIYRPTLKIEDVLRARKRGSAQIGSLEKSIIEFLLDDPIQRENASEEAKRRWKDIGYDRRSAFRPETIEVAKQLSKKYKLGIMANQPEHTTKRLEEHGLLQYFSHSGMSASYGFHKPDPRLFEEIFKETGANPMRSAMIDDNVERGLIPAKRLGMKTIWYMRNDADHESHPSVDAVIESLMELLKI